MPVELGIYDDTEIFPRVFFFQSYIADVVSKLAWVAIVGDGQYEKFSGLNVICQY